MYIAQSSSGHPFSQSQARVWSTPPLYRSHVGRGKVPPTEEEERRGDRYHILPRIVVLNEHQQSMLLVGRLPKQEDIGNIYQFLLLCRRKKGRAGRMGSTSSPCQYASLLAYIIYSFMQYYIILFYYYYYY